MITKRLRLGAFTSTFRGLLFLAIAMPACGCGAAASGGDVPPVSQYVWTQIESVQGGLIYCISVQPKTHEVYVASETMRGGFFGAAHNPANGTWKTDDGGKNWKRIGPGGNNVKVSPAEAKVIYANDCYGLYKTSDGGATWQTILKGQAPPPARTADTMPTDVDPDNEPLEMNAMGYKALDIFAGDANIVYAGTPGVLHASRDGGKTWQDHKLPTTPKGGPSVVQVIQVHPTNPDIVFILFYGRGSGGLWKTTNGGKTLEQIGSLGGRAMAVAPSNPDVIYTSTGVTQDGGKTWTPISSGAWCITVHPKRPDVAYFSRPGMPVLATVTGGRVIYPIQGIGSNYDGTEVEGLAIDGDLDILWAGGDIICQATAASKGATRLVRSDRGMHDLSLSDIQSAPSGVWACSDAQGIHYSRDGKKWITTAMGMNGSDALHRVAPSPAQNDIIYAGHETTLYKSSDGGRTWFGIYSKWFPYCIIDPSDANVVYISWDSGKGGMVRSTDGGMSFHELGKKGRFLGVLPGEPQLLYVEKDGALHVSKDRGQTLEVVGGQGPFGDFFVSRHPAGLLLSARGKNGCFRSLDGGKNWDKLRLSLSGPTKITQIADGTLWLSDPAVGTVRSQDNGLSWESVWDTVGAMAPDPWDSNSLYMITRGGIWWVHPKNVTRQEQLDTPSDDPAPAKAELAGPMLVDRSNTTYALTKDLELPGRSRSLVMMPRGLKNITLDGGGHTVRCTGGSAIFGDDAEKVTIRDFRFVLAKNSTGIQLTNCRNLKILNCTFEGEGRSCVMTQGILTQDVLVEDCRFVNSGKASAIIGQGKHTIRRCMFSGNEAISLLLADGSIIEANELGKAKIDVKESKDVRQTP